MRYRIHGQSLAWHQRMRDSYRRLASLWLKLGDPDKADELYAEAMKFHHAIGSGSVYWHIIN